MKKKLIIFGVLLVILLIGYASFFAVNYYKNHKNELTLYGNIEIREVSLSFRVAGMIDEMYVEEGDLVQKGDLLAKLEDTVYLAEFNRSEADVILNKANYSKALDSFKRHIPLCKNTTTSKIECKAIKTSKEVALSALEISQAQNDKARKDFEDTRIYAPAKGIIMTRVQEPGAVVSAGLPIYSLAKSEPIWVRVYIPETNLGNVKYGMKARVYTDSFNPETGERREYKGEVGYVSPVAEFTPKTVETTELRTDLVYRVRVYINDIDDFLRQGMPVTVKLDLSLDNDIENQSPSIEDGKETLN